MLTILGIEDVKTAADTAPKLTRAQKVDVVRRLAGFEQPGAIAKSMKEDLGIEITRQTIAFYDPTRCSRCPKHWAVLFWKMRAEIIEGKTDVGAAHPTVRLLWLDQMARAQMEKGNTAEARALLKQAADEVSRMAEHRDDGSDATDSELSELQALAAECGYALVPLEAQAAAGGDGAAGESQPPGEPVSG